MTATIALCFMGAMASRAGAQAPAPAQGSSASQAANVEKPAEEDPFADLAAMATPQSQKKAPDRRSIRSLFTDDLSFRKEVMSQFVVDGAGSGASRQSVGFELLKRFSTTTSTVASFNFQGRLVRRDGFTPVANDMEGEHRPGWAFEYHNFYFDLFNVFNPLLGDAQRGRNVGRFNLRAGRFYVPFGLNLQTDTHGAVLQLSNERNLGFERDWYAGFWGTLNGHLNYDAYFLAGSGYDLKFNGQSGLAALRISLASKYSSEYGLEGGVSVLSGERLSPVASESMQAAVDGMETSRPMSTRRVGFDARYRRAVSTGLVTWTAELSGGRDARDSVFMQLHQAEYLHRSRRWGVAAQYRSFRREDRASDPSLAAELTWYLRNDVASSNLHWIKINVERRLNRVDGRPGTVIALQYYFYR
jgi:hypothetical protein